jgi:hypothetical protein
MRLQKPFVDFAQIGSRIINRRSPIIGGVIQRNMPETPALTGTLRQYCLKMLVNRRVLARRSLQLTRKVILAR